MMKRLLVVFLLGSLLASVSACGAPTLPTTVQEKIKDVPVLSHLDTRNLKLEVTGTGTPLPNDRQAGIDTVICYKLSYDGFYLGEASKLEPETYWEPAVHSGIATHMGDAWQWGRTSKAAWEQHACPGMFESTKDD